MINCWARFCGYAKFARAGVVNMPQLEALCVLRRKCVALWASGWLLLERVAAAFSRFDSWGADAS
jgi:hypothetical protein